MASGMPSTPSLIGKMLNAVSNKVGPGVGGADAGANPMDRIARLGMSPRQQALNRLWAWYRCSNYQARSMDWDGRKVVEPLDVEAIASRGFVPPGFVDAGQSMPIKFRRPTAPYALVKVVVDRFTGLLFSEHQHPDIDVAGDWQTEEYLKGIADVSRLWQTMIRARGMGGAMGAVCVGFQFADGKPVIELHDPRWTKPDFIDRATHKLRSIDKRFMYPQEVRDPATGRYVTVNYWYRRYVDEERDVLFKPVEVGNGQEPAWEVEREVSHGFGFCPVVWVQNLPVEDEIDGDPDCHGAYDMVEAIDALIAQANRGIIANCDPTLVITSKAEMGTEIRKGSDNALKLPEGSVNYLEMSGSGPKAALDFAEQLRKYFLEVVQCVLEHPDTGGKTATEIERSYASMLAKADVLREQYGERCVKPLLEMMLKAARTLEEPRAQMVEQPGPDGQPVQQQVLLRQKLTLPPVYEKDEQGQDVARERVLGPGGSLELKWPGYFRSALGDVNQAVQAAVGALSGGIVDDETAVKFIAPYFEVEDAMALVDKVRKAKQEASGGMMSPAAEGVGGGFDEYGAEEGEAATGQEAFPDYFAESEGETPPEEQA